jgi:hypothetical protein
LLSACVFALELRRWFDEGVRLAVTVMVDAKLVAGGQVDEETYLSATVTNRGSAPTTVTHMLLYNYPNRLAQHMPDRLVWFISGLGRRIPHGFNWLIQRLRPETAFVISIGTPGPIPFVLQPGHTWVGMAIHTAVLENWIKAGRLYVGIVGSHSDKTLFKRVRRWKPPIDTNVG